MLGSTFQGNRVRLEGMKYFFHDFETGGFENTSILTFYGATTDSQFNITGEVEFFIRPENGVYHVEAQALMVNKINIVDHYVKSEDKSTCNRKIRDFIMKATSFGTSKLTSAGHNVYFDNGLLKNHFFTDYNDFFYRHNLDTGSLALLLKHIGRLPDDFQISLVNLANHYGIDATGAHESKTDTLMTIAVLKCMMSEIKV